MSIGGPPHSADLTIRPYEDRDEGAVVDLLAASLGKEVDDHYRAFFRWKHIQNPFGRSFMWVAEVDGRPAGFRAFLRWRFLDPSGAPVEAVRAVDTATAPELQGLGIFRRLTLHGLDEMAGSGVEFVFNTPNDQSRPGYLKMGWRIEQRVPVRLRLRSPHTAPTVLRANRPASHASLALEIGEPVSALTGRELGPPVPSPGRLVTERTLEFLHWRHAGHPEVASTLVRSGDTAVILRLRRRGPALECTVGDVVGAPSGSAAWRAVRSAMRAGRADYALASAASAVRGMVPVPRLGPIQTRRDVEEAAVQLPLSLTLADVELF